MRVDSLVERLDFMPLPRRAGGSDAAGILMFLFLIMKEFQRSVTMASPGHVNMLGSMTIGHPGVKLEHWRVPTSERDVLGLLDEDVRPNHGSVLAAHRHVPGGHLAKMPT